MKFYLEEGIDSTEKVSPWTSAEQKRTIDASDMVWFYYRERDYYKQESEVIYREELGDEYSHYSGKEVTISKCWFVYSESWDEEHNRVPRGKRVPTTIYYSVAIDGDLLDENVLGYKTKTDAMHALKIELQYMRKTR